MSRITISSIIGWNNQNRSFSVYLDSQKIGMIKSGETKNFEIESGEHKLKVKSGLFGIRMTPFSLNPDENKNLELSGFELWKWLLSAGLLIGVLFFIAVPYLDFYDEKLFLIFLILPEVVYLFYYLTFRFKLKF